MSDELDIEEIFAAHASEIDVPLADLFRVADMSFLESGKTDLDDLGYRFISNFFKNTYPVSAYGLFLLSKLQAQKDRYDQGYQKDKTIFTQISHVFPPSSIAYINEFEKLSTLVREKQHEKYEAGSAKGEGGLFCTRRRKQIEKFRTHLKETENIDDMSRAKINERIAEYEADIVGKEADILLLEAKKATIVTELADLNKKLEAAAKAAEQRAYSMSSINLLAGSDKKSVEFRVQIESDWAFLLNWFEKKIVSAQSERKSSFRENFFYLCDKLGIPEQEKNILIHALLIERVEFYKVFYNNLPSYDAQSRAIDAAKLCNISPDTFSDVVAGHSDLTRKGILEDAFALKINPKISSILDLPHLTQDEILIRIAGVPASRSEAVGYKWQSIEAAQGAGAEELHRLIVGKKEDASARALTALVYGEKGSGKTQGAIKATLEAGYENAVLAHEFDEKGKPLSYSERISAIKLALAVGETIPDFFLIVDEIDKMGGDRGATDSLALLRLFEGARTPVIATANNDKFSEAFKDRFGYSVRFHVSIANGRIDMFFAMAAGKIHDLEENRAAYEDMLVRTEVLPRAMEQAIDNAAATGRGIDSIRLSFRAKAELMTHSRTGLAVETPVIEPWRYDYFCGRLREPKNTSIEDLLNHIGKLPKQDQGVMIILGAAHKKVEMAAFAAEAAKRLSTDILWIQGGSKFSSRDDIEKALNQAQDMRLMLAIEGADSLTLFDNEKILGMFERHSLPLIFLTNNSKNIDQTASLTSRAHFIIDCYLPDLRQCAAMGRQFLNIDLSEDALKKMPGITLDIFQMTAYKRRQVLKNPEDPVQITALLQSEYQNAIATFDDQPVFAEWLEIQDKNTISQAVSNPGFGKNEYGTDFWGPKIRF